jgi:chromosome partitioning protein
MHVYAVALEKGGVGKSALSWLGVRPDAVRADDSVLGLLAGRPLDACVRATEEGVDLLPAHPAMASLPMHIAAAPNSGLFVLRDALGQGPAYDVVILDLAPARGPVQATALTAATRCIAPVQPEDLVIKALSDLVTTVAQAQRLNPDLRGISIVRNKYLVRSAGDQVYDQALKDGYGTALLTTIIPNRAALRDSPGLGQSVFRYTGGDASDVRQLPQGLKPHGLYLTPDAEASGRIRLAG